MSSGCNQLELLGTALTKLEASLVFLGVQHHPNPQEGIENRESQFTNILSKIMEGAKKIFDFEDPVNIFSSDHLDDIDLIIRLELGTTHGISRDDAELIYRLLEDVTDAHFTHLDYDKCVLMDMIICVRLQFILAGQGIHLRIIPNHAGRRTHARVLLQALYVADKYTGFERSPLNQSDKDAFLTGFVRFVRVDYNPNLMYTIMRKRRPAFFHAMRTALLNNGFDRVVFRLDNYFEVVFAGSDHEPDDYSLVEPRVTWSDVEEDDDDTI